MLNIREKFFVHSSKSFMNVFNMKTDNLKKCFSYLLIFYPRFETVNHEFCKTKF